LPAEGDLRAAPDRISALVLCCTSAGGEGGASYPLQRLARVDEDERLSRHVELMDTRWDASWQAANPDIVELIRARGDVGGQSEEAAMGVRRQLEAREGTHVPHPERRAPRLRRWPRVLPSGPYCLARHRCVLVVVGRAAALRG
jgi:hypothetical protein